MHVFNLITQASIIALVSLLLPLVPMGMGIAYAIRPSEQRLAVMRPLSLAAIFAVVAAATLGIANVLRNMALDDVVGLNRVGQLGLSEALIPLVTGFGCLTIGWLAVAVGLRRHP